MPKLPEEEEKEEYEWGESRRKGEGVLEEWMREVVGESLAGPGGRREKQHIAGRRKEVQDAFSVI